MAKKQKESKFELVKTVLIAGLIALGFRSFLFEPFNIPSGSMVPTLLVGDYLFVSKFSYGYSRYSFPFGIAPFSGRIFEDKPERGDVAVFRQPTDPSIAFIKRVVGLPGDQIQVQGGILHINGVPVKRTYLGQATATDGYSMMNFKVYEETLSNGSRHLIQERSDSDSYDNTAVYQVPDGHYFMMAIIVTIRATAAQPLLGWCLLKIWLVEPIVCFSAIMAMPAYGKSGNGLLQSVMAALEMASFNDC